MENQRTQMVAGNWKMNTDYNSGRDLAQAVIKKLQPTDVKVVLIPPYTHLKNVSNLTSGVSNLYSGAQNCHAADSGAYTGEVSTGMLKSVGVTYVVLGHSERRQYFGETDASVAEKIDAVLAAGLIPIFCCGEALDIREAGDHEQFVSGQLKNSLFHLDKEQIQTLVIAYEPIWAIGTGKTASPEQAQEMHAAIRKVIAEKFGQEVADQQTILYGGSCKPGNARELFAQPDVDGGLIGGASLKADDFIAIINSFE
jgi:triosephosphate isomerase